MTYVKAAGRFILRHWLIPAFFAGCGFARHDHERARTDVRLLPRQKN